jgi:hypothetical protein
VAALTEDGSKSVETVILPDGEQYKTMEVLMAVWDRALTTRLDRKSTFLALGGGVIGDMTGFAAASYQRGVHFLQVRTRTPFPHGQRHPASDPSASADVLTGRCAHREMIPPGPCAAPVACAVP